MNFPQLVRSVRQRPARAYWFWGPEIVLVEDGIDVIRRALKPDVYRSFSVEDGELELAWAALDQIPPEGSRALTLIRGVGGDEDLTPLVEWLEDRMPLSHVIVTASKPHEDPVTSAFVRRGSTVKASLTDKAKEDYCRAYVPGMDRLAVRYLIELTGGDVYEMRTCLKKLRLLTPTPSEALIQALAEVGTSEDDFAQALVQLRKPQALKALAALPKDSYASIVGLLDSRLDALNRIHSGVVRGQTAQVITASTMLKPFIVQILMPYAKHYDRARVRSCARTLSVVDDRLRRGDTAGVMEMLVMLW